MAMLVLLVLALSCLIPLNTAVEGFPDQPQIQENQFQIQNNGFQYAYDPMANRTPEESHQQVTDPNPFGVTTNNNSDLCPDPQAIRPCECIVEDEYINFDCSSVTSEEELKEVFQQNFTEITHARKLTILDNIYLTVLHSGVFGDTDFREIEIRGTNIFTVEAGAFSGSYSRAVKMNFKDNKISSFPFSEVEDFTALETLDVSSNVLQEFPKIKSSSLRELFVGMNAIPIMSQDSFKYTPMLEAIRLNRCGISEIREGTFSVLKYLRQVDLNFNQLTQTISANTFPFNGTITSLYLGNNNISTLEANAFTGISNLVVVGTNSIEEVIEDVWRPTLENGARVELKENPLKCRCDIAWLVRDLILLGRVFRGAACSDGTLIHNLDPDWFDDCD